MPAPPLKKIQYEHLVNKNMPHFVSELSLNLVKVEVDYRDFIIIKSIFLLVGKKRAQEMY